MAGAEKTPAPEEIFICLNAADMIDRGYDVGYKYPYPGHEFDEDELLTLLKIYNQNFFKLLGWTATHIEVNLKIQAIDLEGQVITVANPDPPFVGDYQISDHDIPRVTTHGDLTFQLALAKEENG